jgi:hypothetical protein
MTDVTISSETLKTVSHVCFCRIQVLPEQYDSERAEHFDGNPGYDRKINRPFFFKNYG